MIVLERLVRDRIRGMRWWALGTVVGVTATVVLYPTIRGEKQIESLLRDLPSGVQAMLGSDINIPITSAAGYLQARLFSTLLPILFIVYAVGVGARVIGGAEEDGTLQLVVTQPVTRRGVALGRLGAAVILVASLALVALAATLLLSYPVGIARQITAPRMVIATGAVAGLAVLHLAVAFAVGAATGRRAPAITAGSSLAVGGYLLHGLSASAEAARPLRALSPFWWVLDKNLLVHNPTFLALGLPVLLAVVIAAAGLALYERRDLHFP